MIKQFILKSNKVYAILGAGIAICLCMIVFNVGVQTAESPAGYSNEYLQGYGVHMWAYGEAGVPQETASQWAANACDLLVGK